MAVLRHLRAENQPPTPEAPEAPLGDSERCTVPSQRSSSVSSLFSAMRRLHTSRLSSAATFSGLLFCALSLPLSATGRHGQAGPSAGGQRGGYSQQQHSEATPRGTLGPRPGQEHLAQWMSHHGNLPAPDQQRALEREPGFRDLSPQVQQRMRDRLTQLNNMPPQQRQHVLDRAEAMERLAPEQRQRVRGTMQQLSSLPEDRRRIVAHAFRELRTLPPDQRQAALASGRYSDFSPEERSTLNNLNEVEPLLPPPPTPRPSYPGVPPR